MKMNHFLRFSRSGERGVRSKIAFKLLMLVLLAVPASMLNEVQAQTEPEAFYIYRNDGDFDGFFYDRVLRMNFSKIGVDSVEYDYYVVQELETPDSIYRIPLAAIDSIGFQQPEIRFNPKLKNMDELGITPYVTQTRDYYGFPRLGISKSIPSHLLPQIGDVLAGANPDVFQTGGWVGRITGESSPASYLDEDDQSYYYTVEFVDDLADVFEQYITVEDVGYDEQGNMRRRIAGCDANGMPRKAESGGGSINLVDISGTFTRSWEPNDHLSIDLSAELGLKVGLHVAYNISWRRVFVKLSRDFSLSAKPSLGIKAAYDVEYQIGDLAPYLKAIPFPASFPVLQTAPLPDLFVRASGGIEARLNFPTMQFGLGESIIIDTDLPYFPLRYDFYKVAEEKKVEEELFENTGSADISLNGFIQTGLKFSANVSTAYWMQKILSAGMELNLYCGPRIYGQFSISFNGNDDSHLPHIYNGQMIVSKCSVDLEAKASAAIMWKDPKEKTFFSKNWLFGSDTLYVIPPMQLNTAGYYEGEGIKVSATPKNKSFIPMTLGFGLYNPGAIDSYNNLNENQRKPHDVQLTPGTFFLSSGPKEITALFPTEGLRTGDFDVVLVANLFGATLPAYTFSPVHINHKFSYDKIRISSSGGKHTINYTYSGHHIWSNDHRVVVNPLEGDYDRYDWDYKERRGTIVFDPEPNYFSKEQTVFFRIRTDDGQDIFLSFVQDAKPADD